MRLANLTLANCLASAWTGEPGRCQWCNCLLTGKQRRWCDKHRNAWACNHLYTLAKRQVMKRDKRKCRRCGNVATEINHIDPALGRHKTKSCIHHQDNLEAVCHSCHLQITKEQHQAGAFKVP